MPCLRLPRWDAKVGGDMPKCIECSEYYSKLKWCKAKMIHIKREIAQKDLPCNNFKLKPNNTYVVQETKPVIRQIKKENTFRREYMAEFGFPVFPYWLSQYIISSIQTCGDMSLAYDLLLQDACPEFKKQLEQEKWWKNER
jgi:hypothetical protein